MLEKRKSTRSFRVTDAIGHITCASCLLGKCLGIVASKIIRVFQSVFEFFVSTNLFSTEAC